MVVGHDLNGVAAAERTLNAPARLRVLRAAEGARVVDVLPRPTGVPHAATAT